MPGPNVSIIRRFHCINNGGGGGGGGGGRQGRGSYVGLLGADLRQILWLHNEYVTQSLETLKQLVKKRVLRGDGEITTNTVEPPIMDKNPPHNGQTVQPTPLCNCLYISTSEEGTTSEIMLHVSIIWRFHCTCIIQHTLNSLTAFLYSFMSHIMFIAPV